MSGSFFPQNDPDKEYNMPKDGTVHELTSNVGAARGVLGRGGDQPGPEPPALHDQGAEGKMDKVLSDSRRQALSRQTRPIG